MKWNAYTKGPKAGQPKTATDRVVRYLIEGLKTNESLSKSKKYRTFEKPGQQGTFYFVGTAGAVRVGESSSTSISITDKMKSIIERWERNTHPEEF